MERKKWGEREARIFKYGLLVLLVFMLAAIQIIDPTFYPTIYHLSETGDMGDTIVFLKSYGVYAALVSFFIDVVVNISGFLPSIFISTANGLVFGLFWGVIISWLAETVGVLISFWVMRVLFRDVAQRIIEKSKTLAKLNTFDSWEAMAMARAIPYMPNGLVTALAALSRMHFRHYALGCLVGKLPSTALEVVLGHDMVNFEDHSLRLTFIVLLVCAIYGGIWWYTKRRKRKLNS